MDNELEDLDNFENWEPEPPSTPEQIEFGRAETAGYMNMWADQGKREKVISCWQSMGLNEQIGVKLYLQTEAIKILQIEKNPQIVERLFKISRKTRKRLHNKGFG
jgi:hypothetical protein